MRETAFYLLKKTFNFVRVVYHHKKYMIPHPGTESNKFGTQFFLVIWKEKYDSSAA